MEATAMRGSRFWPIVGVLFLVVNAGGAVYAVAMGEMPHAGIHVALLAAGVFLMQQFARGRDARRLWLRETPAAAAPSGQLDDQLSHLEQSLDAVAIEVERIGEAQRFMTKVVADRGSPAERAGQDEKGES
jgi:hypothetical protein